ncbi:SDR family NAD(P)-dependent oxidoreductase [Nocardia farcinica]|uniref:SDR family NAD(P)-dependent oxidoreductase n=1 Tax=Nocardia farcinica TaxID=37329 RepID=UPI0024579827|nr:SDR family NAD(P)-dependent oxidoreductase [Nocardia farcinica]
MHPLERYRGGWALVTGSARAIGLGFTFARQVAEHGINIVLVDIDGEQLQERSAELAAAYRVQVRSIAVDLGRLEDYPSMYQQVDDIDIDVLICNHMYTPKDTPEILDMPLAVHNSMLDINARAYVNLIHHFGAEMRRRDRGAIIVVSSGAGLTSAPYTAAYSANKAFQIAFAEALSFELRHTAVDVLIMVAGLMNTQGDGLSKYPKWQIAEPADAAAETLRALGRKLLVMPGWPNRLQTLLMTRGMSRARAVRSVGAFMAKGLGK